MQNNKNKISKIEPREIDQHNSDVVGKSLGSNPLN